MNGVSARSGPKPKEFNAHTGHAKKNDSILFFQSPNVYTCLLLSFGKIWSMKTISMISR